MQLLSNTQKMRICQAARRAWDSNESRRDDWLERNPELSKSKIFELWRQLEQQQCIGISSLTQAVSEEHYLRLLAHFQDLAGDSGDALKNLLRHADEEQLQTLNNIKASCDERNLDFPGYPGAICRRQFKCALDAASPKQLWSLLFTVRNRRRVGGARAKSRAKPKIKQATLPYKVITKSADPF
ncbi:hypothetical protein [Cerasicoccus maritimus]|uniref:hypothetical protein n=1 Tax=Cerasicoccus maritimus TaxID=490089 RepID=UPI0028525012|nr:hypothetical protein [Cerasicoccus maritimus]